MSQEPLIQGGQGRADVSPDDCKAGPLVALVFILINAAFLAWSIYTKAKQ